MLSMFAAILLVLGPKLGLDPAPDERNHRDHSGDHQHLMLAKMERNAEDHEIHLPLPHKGDQPFNEPLYNAYRIN